MLGFSITQTKNFQTSKLGLERTDETEIILSFMRLHPSTVFQTFVDYDGHSISSKAFLPTVVDIMVI